MSNCARLAGGGSARDWPLYCFEITTRSPCFDQGHIQPRHPRRRTKKIVASGRLIKFGTGKVTDYYPIFPYILLDFTLYPFVKISNEFGVIGERDPRITLESTRACL